MKSGYVIIPDQHCIGFKDVKKQPTFQEFKEGLDIEKYERSTILYTTFLTDVTQKYDLSKLSNVDFASICSFLYSEKVLIPDASEPDKCYLLLKQNLNLVENYLKTLPDIRKI